MDSYKEDDEWKGGQTSNIPMEAWRSFRDGSRKFTRVINKLLHGERLPDV